MITMGKDEGVFNATNQRFCLRELARHVVLNDSVDPLGVVPWPPRSRTRHRETVVELEDAMEWECGDQVLARQDTNSKSKDRIWFPSSSSAFMSSIPKTTRL